MNRGGKEEEKGEDAYQAKMLANLSWFFSTLPIDSKA